VGEEYVDRGETPGSVNCVEEFGGELEGSVKVPAGALC
jgi:hypothetical protein